MPIQSYSVLKGRPTAGKVVTGSSSHYQVTVQATGGPFTAAVNIQSTDGSQVLYAIQQNFTPPDPAGLQGLAPGFTRLASQPRGLALDFVREQIGGRPMVTRAELTLLPIPGSPADLPTPDGRSSAASALSDAVTDLIQKAIASANATVYIFGSAYADAGKTDGIHDIHMNQGNPSPGSFARDNGIWQDGALLIAMPSAATAASPVWSATFIAFQTESWSTDSTGNPTGNTRS